MRVWWAAALVLGSVSQVGWGQFAGSTDKSGHTRLSLVAKTVSLSEVRHPVETVADVPEMKYENGYFVGLADTGAVTVLDKEGRTTANFKPRPEIKDFAGEFVNLQAHDVTAAADGSSVVVSVVFMLPKDARRYFYLLKYDKEGNFVEQTDLGAWRATRICSAEDGSIWTLSGEERLGRSVYSPGEGVLRNYKTSAGLQKAVAPRSQFAEDSRNSFANNSAIDCSNGVHALTGNGQWLDYTSDGTLTAVPLDDAGPDRADRFPKLRGFAYLETGHVYGLFDDGSRDATLRRFVALLPSADGLTLHWSAIALQHPKSDVSAALGESTPSPAQTVTYLLGADHSDGEQIVRRTSAGSAIVWAQPVLQVR
jgi:hypothetical protein